VTINLRPGDELTDDAVVLIHMGAGDPANIARGAVTNLSAYVGLREPGAGEFTISVFAATAGVSESEITGAFGHSQFGRATYGALRRAGFELLPTTIAVTGMMPAIEALQRVHFDIILDVDFAGAAVPEDEAELAELETAVASAAAAALELFLPRQRKAPG